MRKLWLTLPALLSAALCAGCAIAIDAQQHELCRRVIAALHPEQTVWNEIRATALPRGEPGLRLDYSAREPGMPSRSHFVACHFEGKGLDANRLNLARVETQDGALGEARLLYLKRFWLAQGAGETMVQSGARWQISPPLAYALQQIINGLAPGAIYGLLAVAYSLVYGLVGRINLAFGGIAVIGGYAVVLALALGLAAQFAPSLWLLGIALVVGAAISAMWSVVIGDRVIAPLHARHRAGQPILVATIGAAIAIEEFLRLSQSARERWLPPFFSDAIPVAQAGHFVVSASVIQIVIVGCALAASFALLFVIGRTGFGRQWRAFADDPLAAALSGVRTRRLFAASFALAGASAGLAGWAIAIYYGNVSFFMGTMLGLKALLAAILGGIGRLDGALIGGLLIGLIEAFWSAYFDLGSRDVVVFSLLIVMFVLRPGGLFGFSGPSPREV